MKPSTVQPEALKTFAGLSKALRGLTKVHSYTMDLGFALGLLDQCKGAHLEFCVDGSRYRPAQLPKAEWKAIVNSSHFYLNPKYRKNGIFHSKAWFCKKGLLLGSANLSILEARYNLNFWFWMPGDKWGEGFRYLDKGKSCTMILSLNDHSRVIVDTPLDALRYVLKGKYISNMVIVSPERPSQWIFSKIGTFLSEQGNCCFFLRHKEQAIKRLLRKSRWKVSNYIPLDKSIGLHGKAMYGEWDQDERQGAVLYLGSSNFTKKGYSGGNIESGVLIEAEGTAQVKKLQDALLSLLGKSGPPSRDQKAWATERFDGRWRWVKPDDKDLEKKGNQYQNQDDIDRSLFNSRLKAKLNQLFFPSRYGTNEIMQAELSGYGELPPQIWEKPGKRQFASVFWSPALELKLRLRGGRSVPISVPPLEGLMSKEGQHAELLELLFEESEPIKGPKRKRRKKQPLNTDASIFAGQRVLFPWKAILRSKQGERLLKSKRALDRAIDQIQCYLQNSIGTGDDAKRLQRKLEIWGCTLQGLRSSL